MQVLESIKHDDMCIEHAPCKRIDIDCRFADWNFGRWRSGFFATWYFWRCLKSVLRWMCHNNLADLMRRHWAAWKQITKIRKLTFQPMLCMLCVSSSKCLMIWCKENLTENAFGNCKAKIILKYVYLILSV